MMYNVLSAIIYVLGVVRFFIFVHFVMSWLISFQVLNVRQEFVGQVWYGLQRLMEPIYGPIRRILPPMGGIDLAPLVALVGIQVIIILIRGY